MSFGLSPNLTAPPWTEWERRYPDGLGASAFSAPAFQKLLRSSVGTEFDLCMLIAEDGAGTRYSLPVLARQWRYRRVEITCQPTAYYVLPIECDNADAACIRPVVSAARAPLTSVFRWWLPPWIQGDWASAKADVDTYVIDVDGDPDAFMERTVRKRFREYVRSSHKKGIEITESPTTAEIDEYFALYQRTYQERSWVGEAFTREFFEGVATTLGSGGKLVVMRHAGHVVGGGVVLFDKHAVHYFQGVTDRENTQVKPHLVLYDWLIRTAAARGVRYVNLGGVNDGNSSLTEFKQSWGAKPMPVPHVHWAVDRKWLGRRLGLDRLLQRSPA